MLLKLGLSRLHARTSSLLLLLRRRHDAVLLGLQLLKTLDVVLEGRWVRPFAPTRRPV
jgi:hypothetical protein